MISVLDSLKTGDREDLFDAMENRLRKYVPSIQKLSLRTSSDGKKELQVREAHIDNAFSAAMLSDGTKLIILILTILHQEHTPDIICIEDVDRGLHPRLFQQIVEFLRQVAEEQNIQILATTHNPYLLDEFHEHEDAVIIVEREQAESKLTLLSNRIGEGTVAEDALGSVWYSGLLGGVPAIKA